jgi:hypothetical protein
MRPLLSSSAVLALAFALGACAEKPQTASPSEADTPAWQAAENGYVAPGWKAGDRTSLEQQLRSRAQTQNEYTRVR